jgi:hypothetical protein
MKKKIIGFLSCWDLTNHDVSCYVIGIIGKPSMSRGALNRFHNVSMYGG